MSPCAGPNAGHGDINPDSSNEDAVKPHRFLCALALAGALLAASAALAGPPLADRLLVGYWHNWMSSPVTLRLADVPADYDVVNVSFAVPSAPGSGVMVFNPEPGIYASPAAFTADVQALRQRGQAVLISIGGATMPVQIDTPEKAHDFAQSMHAIITAYGFDGLDIDVEGHSLLLVGGDNDYRNPTSPLVVHFIDAMQQLLAMLPADFIVTAAPETIYVQGGYAGYANAYGAYLPVLHALRDRLAYVHVQHYNTGTMYGRDGAIYEPATADFHVAMADMLLSGFPVYGGPVFEPLRPDQVMLGLPATEGAAGSGYTEPAAVRQALDYLIKGEPFGGQYQLGSPDGFFGFRGVMTWSINWDVSGGGAFADTFGAYLDDLSQLIAVPDDLPDATGPSGLLPPAPNPFNPATTINWFLADAGGLARLDIHDTAGRRVRTLVDGWRESGAHRTAWDGRDDAGRALPSGVYLCRLAAAGRVSSQRLVLAK